MTANDHHLSSHEALTELAQGLIAESPGVVMLFTDASCAVAHAVEPKLTQLLHERFPELRYTSVTRADAPRWLAQLGVFSFPAVIAWFDGKECARFVRHFSLDAVAEALERPYALLLGEGRAEPVRGAGGAAP